MGEGSEEGVAGLRRDWRPRVSGAVDFLLSMVAKTATAPLAFAANALLARLLGPDLFGQYVTLLSIALVAGGLSSFGSGPALTREIASHSIDERADLLLSMGRWAAKLVGLLSLVAVAASLFWLGVGAGAPASDWSERAATVALIPATTFLLLIAGVLNGLSRVAGAQFVQNLWKNAWLLATAIVLFWMQFRSVALVLWMQVAGVASALAIGFYMVRHELAAGVAARRELRTGSIGGRRNERRDWRRLCQSFFAMQVATILLMRLDVVIVGAVAGGVQAGLYGAAARTAQLAQLPGLVWLVWLQPRMAYLGRHKIAGPLSSLLIKGLVGSAGMTFILVVCAWVLAPDIMRLFGAGFGGAVSAFRILILGFFAWSVSVPLLALLSMGGRERIVAAVSWMQVGIAVLCGVPLAMRYGASGGAAAWAVALGLAACIILIFGFNLRKRLSAEAAE